MPIQPSANLADGRPLPGSQPEPKVDLTEAAGGPAKAERHLPHERDQRASDQAAAAGQTETREAQKAYQDAERGLPDTSAAPQLQQPSPHG